MAPKMASVVLVVNMCLTSQLLIAGTGPSVPTTHIHVQHGIITENTLSELRFWLNLSDLKYMVLYQSRKRF